MASVTCLVPQGDLPLDIYWTSNSALIVTGEEGFSVMRINKRTSLLNIDSLEAIHRGVYKCIANNSAGYSEFVSELNVNGLFRSTCFNKASCSPSFHPLCLLVGLLISKFYCSPSEDCAIFL